MLWHDRSLKCEGTPDDLWRSLQSPQSAEKDWLQIVLAHDLSSSRAVRLDLAADLLVRIEFSTMLK